MPLKTVKFPKEFLWGAATAAHQVEGGNHNQWTVWEQENAKKRASMASSDYKNFEVWQHIKARATDPSNYISGKAANHFSQYKEDFSILEKLNLNAFRFGIEWSRLEPEKGQWDAKAIAHYRDYIAELRKRNIEPMVTFFHFSLPIWFEELGGFEKRKNVKYFLRFVEKVMSEYGKDVKYYITINEPQTYLALCYWRKEWPPMKKSIFLFAKVTFNLAYAHRRAVKIIHDLNSQSKVSISNASINVYPGDNSIITKISTSVIQYATEEYFLRRVIKSCDFIGVNFYFSSRVYGFRIHNNDRRKNDLNWATHPDHLTHVLRRLYFTFKKPLIVTENGIADHDDSRRKWWIASTMLALQHAIEEEIDIRGYFHWSLLDNFEWAHGHWPEFGLVHVDQKTSKRYIRPSAIWWGKLVDRFRRESNNEGR
ncbi:glycoside hydrolase family 1 protein [Candidatus Saccharibacteria bacterium]|jgi:beta-glucosidase|nr:glycoside hydrolase family 1 protein [Candidatus Saccharibacteria bacterium]